MSLLEDKDDSLPIQTIPLMLQNKEVDEVKIEEITEEKEEEAANHLKARSYGSTSINTPHSK